MVKSEAKRCTKCVLSESFPNIEFDDEGVCNFCREEILFTSDDKVIERARLKVNEIVNSSKGNREYDAIICFSGGKDSTYTLMLAVKKYGLKVLSFTLDNGFLSKSAFENINRVVDFLGVDHITIRPSAKFFKPVITASVLHEVYNPKTLSRISAGCNSCISLVNITALKLAIEKETPLIIAGFTLGQIPANGVIYKNNYKFLQESREPALNKLREYAGETVDDYYCISDSLLERVKSYPYNINILCLEDISEEEIIKEIEQFGWEKPDDVDGCSSNCRLNTFNNHMHQKKFGYSPYELELSHLIKKGQLSRDDALDKILDQPEQQLKSVVKELGIDESVLNNQITK